MTSDSRSEKGKRASISVFLPAYNDAATIAGLSMTALNVLSTLTDDYEVLVINDGSVDETGEILEELAANHPRIRAIHHESNKGYGAALRTGFDNACKDLIFYTDGDGQYDVHELALLHPLLGAEIDIVNGYKIKRVDTFPRLFLGGIYNRLAHLFFRLPIRDVDCDFRLIRRTALQRIELGASSGVICVELVHKLHTSGAVFAEVPVHHFPRISGKSQFFTFRRVARTALDFVRLWVRLVVRPRIAFRTSPNRSSAEDGQHI
jgi:glycosyltransferase involved in cell wall biosynthesis